MKTEREKMLQGENYKARDPELIELYWRSREVLEHFNRSIASRDRMQILESLLEEVGEGVWVEPTFMCEYGVNLSIGAGTYINVNCFFQDCAKIRIGKSVLIGPGVNLCTSTHPLAEAERVNSDGSYTCSADPITIEDNVWIGANVTVLGGVTIGKGSVIGAGSVVTKDIPAGVKAYGVPCKVI